MDITATRTDGIQNNFRKQDVGRIVIEDIQVPEKKEEMSHSKKVGRIVVQERPQVYRNYNVKPSTSDVNVIRDDVKDITKVGRLDVRELEKTTEDSRTVEERLLTNVKRVDHNVKVMNECFHNIKN